MLLIRKATMEDAKELTDMKTLVLEDVKKQFGEQINQYPLIPKIYTDETYTKRSIAKGNLFLALQEDSGAIVGCFSIFEFQTGDALELNDFFVLPSCKSIGYDLEMLLNINQSWPDKDILTMLDKLHVRYRGAYEKFGFMLYQEVANMWVYRRLR